MKGSQVDTPRNGKNWHEAVNVEPLPAQEERTVLALGTCDRNGGNFKPYPKPIERKRVQLWKGDYRL